MTHTDSISRYLRDWSEPEAQAVKHALDHFPLNASDKRPYVVSVPAYAEPLKWWNTLSVNLEHTPLWWVWVFNQPEHVNLTNPPDACSSSTSLSTTIHSSTLIQDTSASLQLCKQHLRQRIELGPITIGRLNKHHNVILVDRCTQPIPNKYGVGLARKIANDAALILIQAGWVQCPWLFNTDADAHLPPNYFTHPTVQHALSQRTISAFQMGFEHVPCHPDFAEATWCYDHYLRYHYRGLCAADSPYNFTTIGSLSVLSALHYATVRGFPRRSAGEDFYLLNKMRKLAPITTLEAPIIRLSGRPSARVPFGTGPRLREWQHQQRDNIVVWPPEAYEHLQRFITHMCHAAHSEAGTHPLIKGFNTLPNDLAKIAQSLNSGKWIKQTQKQLFPNGEQHERAFHDWFDALKTTQFLRRISATLSPISVEAASQCFLTASRTETSDRSTQF